MPYVLHLSSPSFWTQRHQSGLSYCHCGAKEQHESVFHSARSGCVCLHLAEECEGARVEPGSKRMLSFLLPTPYASSLTSFML